MNHTASNLDDLRPVTACRIASGMSAVFFIASVSGVMFGIRYWMYQFGKPNGLPVVIDASNIVGAFVGAAVGFGVAARFFLYARRLHLQRKSGV